MYHAKTPRIITPPLEPVQISAIFFKLDENKSEVRERDVLLYFLRRKNSLNSDGPSVLSQFYKKSEQTSYE